MARTALIVKDQRRLKKYLAALAASKKPKFPTRIHFRCGLCGRAKGYMRKFGLCRICFRSLASEGLIMGVKKSSW